MRTKIGVLLVASAIVVVVVWIFFPSPSKRQDESFYSKSKVTKESRSLPSSPSPEPALINADSIKTPSLISGSNLASKEKPKQRVLTRFKNVIGDLRHSNMTSSQMAELWSEFWPKSFSEALASSNDPQIAEGRRLPREFGLEKPKEPFSLQVQQGKIANVRSDDEAAAVIAIYSLYASKAVAGGGQLGSLLLERANSLPPSRGDIVTTQIVFESLDMVDNPKKLSSEQMSAWMQIPHAKSSIYRNTALYAFDAVCPVEAQRSAFYEQYFEETDRDTLMLVINKIEQGDKGKAKQLFGKLISRDQVRNDPQLRSYVQAALSRTSQ